MSGAPGGLEVLETCLYAEDLERAADFYGRVLGLREVSRVPGRHVFFRCGGRMFLLFHPAATEAAGGEVPPHGARGPGHVAFAAAEAEIPAWRAALAAAGVEVEREVRWPRGGTSLYLRDPGGNSVEITSPGIWGIPEPEPPPEPAG